MQPNTDSIVLRPDGSIDTAHYAARGRQMRGAQAHHLARGLFRALGGLISLPFRAAGSLTSRQARVAKG